ncbi:LuxR C-terminal-related transcriptional regulator [Amycolatopsis jejuensis]|uniref:LuxR C-terminal-related transcriptional regulator n=1 Tax=Amycolatopsis jejuensis TaxID=330084 RepID=UPI0007C5C814|nr:LuxR C-terminal-related transcriptional regulator [Amycolatopsis jejuensis]
MRVVLRPALFDRLATAGRVTVVSAPPGSGKSVLVRSWIEDTGLAERVGWVSVVDPPQFWPAVLDALTDRPVTPAPNPDAWAIVERLLGDLAPLAERRWLVIDDVHELSPETRRQLELLVLRAPAELRFILLTREDVRGLHRLRLDGDLTEIRDLRFTPDEARQLLDDVPLPEKSLTLLLERTEGWVAGLRLAALSLAGHPDPERFVAEFSGSERTVAEYLVAEVLERQPDDVRNLLLRTSILEQVNGDLADLLTGGGGGARILQDLEQANAFVQAQDTGRTWFRYHRMFADLLRLHLRRTAADEAALHRTAAEWLSQHGFPVEAIRQAQAAREWPLATRLLVGHWPALLLDGQAATAHDLLAGFPPDGVTGELAVLLAADELAHGSVEVAQRYLEQAAESPVREVVRLMLARRLGDLPTVDELVRQQSALDEDLRALALISLDSTEYWTADFAEAQRHLERGRAPNQRPYLEFASLAYQAANEFFLSFDQAVDHGLQAVELAQRHGWTDEPPAGAAYMTLGAVRAWQGRLDESEPWVKRAERTIRPEAHPLAGMGIAHVRATLAMARGRNTEAVAAFGTAERLSRLVTAPNPVTLAMQGFQLQALVRLGDIERVEQVIAGFDPRHRNHSEVRIVQAMLRLADSEPLAASDVLAPVLDHSAPVLWPAWRTQAYLLEAVARDALGHPAAAGHALERALDLAEPDGALIWFLLHPVPDLLARHATHRTRHAGLIADLRSLLAGRTPPSSSVEPLLDPLSESEIRVLRYLPTNLSIPEVAGALTVSRNTVKTHIRNLYRKLGVHRRSTAVDRARALGLLAPSTGPQAIRPRQ